MACRIFLPPEPNRLISIGAKVAGTGGNSGPGACQTKPPIRNNNQHSTVPTQCSVVFFTCLLSSHHHLPTSPNQPNIPGYPPPASVDSIPRCSRRQRLNRLSPAHDDDKKENAIEIPTRARGGAEIRGGGDTRAQRCHLSQEAVSRDACGDVGGLKGSGRSHGPWSVIVRGC